MSRALLSFEALAIGYRPPGRPPLQVAAGLEAALGAGELVCLVGPNGAGKSTLLRTLAGLQPALAGEVRIGGEPLASFRPRELARSVGVVLTEPVQAGLLSAADLVGLGRYARTDWLGRLGEEDRRVVARCLRAVGAEELAGRVAAELSDGERQKVMIARALAQEPALLVLDEPTAFLDLPRRVEIMTLLRELAHQAGRAVLLSSHDLDLALRSADRLWLLDGGGKLTSGAPEDLVLSGAVAAAFRGRGVVFDIRQGAFVFAPGNRETVGVKGDEPAAAWTRRALRRAGFRPAGPDPGGDAAPAIAPQAPAPAAPQAPAAPAIAPQAPASPDPAPRAQIRVSRRGDGHLWRCRCGGAVSEHGSIHDLLACLERALPR